MNEKNNETAQSFAAAGTAHVNLTVEFSLLSADLIGAAERNEKGVEFLVMPQQRESSQTFPLESAVDGINELFKNITESEDFKLSARDVFEKIKEFIGNVVLESLKVSIHRVFIHFTRSKEGKLKFEYAFSIGIDIKDDLPYAQLKSLAFGIWNTDNHKVLAKMGLLNIEEQLALIGESD